MIATGVRSSPSFSRVGPGEDLSAGQGSQDYNQFRLHQTQTSGAYKEFR